MQDRAATKPNRYAVYDENHNFLRYEYHERADEPTQAGTALNKATLLDDAVETLLWGGTANRTVSQALAQIKSLVDARAKIVTGSYTGTGTFGAANKNSITFPSTPRFVLLYNVSSPSYTIILCPGAGTYWGFYNESNIKTGFQSVSGNTFFWWSTVNANFQMNVSGELYNYTAFL